MGYPHGTELVSASKTIYNALSDSREPINFDKIYEATLHEGDNPLGREIILHQHLYGAAMWDWSVSGHGVLHEEVVAYAAVIGFAEHAVGKLAEIGSVVATADNRGKGYGTVVANQVIKQASSQEALSKYGHCGFIATCDAKSIGFFVAKLGFEQTESETSGYTAVKML